MFSEFKTFISQGNVLELAIAFILATAFGAIIASFVKDIVMPPIGLVLGGLDFSNLYINLSNRSYPSLSAAQAAGAPTINYGLFLNTVINFLIVAFVMFLIIRSYNKARPTPLSTRECPYCLSTVPLQATRCPNCTSDLKAA